MRYSRRCGTFRANVGHSTSQVVVEQRLNSFVNSVDPHAREGSIMSFHTAYSALEAPGTTSGDALPVSTAIYAEDNTIESIPEPNSPNLAIQQSGRPSVSADDMGADIGEMDARISAREGSIRSFETAESLSRSDIMAWKDTRRDLESLGITMSAFEANREFILGWFKDAMEAGDIVVNVEANSVPDVPQADEQFPVTAIPWAHRSPAIINEVESLYDMAVLPELLDGQEADFEAKRAAVIRLIHRLLSLKMSYNHIFFALRDDDLGKKRISPPSLGRISLQMKRLSTLQDTISSSRQHVIQALKNCDYSRVLQYLDQLQTPSENLLNRILLGVIQSYGTDRKELVLETVTKLLDMGASPNAVEASPRKRSVLMCVIEKHDKRDLDIVRLLLERGADANYDQGLRPRKRYHRSITWGLTTPLMASLIDGDLVLVSLLIRHGADVNFDLTAGKEAGNKRSTIFRNPIEAAVASLDFLKLQLLFDNGVRTGWLRALDEYHEILSGEPVHSRRGTRSRNRRDETVDGYRELERLLLRDAMLYVLHGRLPDRYEYFVTQDRNPMSSSIDSALPP